VETVRPAADIDQFLIDQVGEAYFREHYTLVHKEETGGELIKASYHYTYEPYVRDHVFTLLFDLKGQALARDQVSAVLLAPQAFKIGPDEAIAIALQNGLAPTAGTYEVNVEFGPATDNRFAWAVISPGIGPTSDVPDPIARVVLDVEGGDVYALGKVAPMMSH
jgi:hypothetical protein